MLWSTYIGRKINTSMLEENGDDELEINNTSPYKDVILVMEKYNIKHIGKTLSEIFYQIDYKLMTEIKRIERKVPNCTLQDIEKSERYSDLEAIRQNLIALREWLFEPNEKPESNA